MRSIRFRLRKLKTHKRVCSLLFSLILGLGLFGGLSLDAFASSTDYTDNTFISNWQHQYAINNYKRYDPVIDWISSANNLIFGYYDMSVNVQGYNYPFQDSGVAQYTGALTDTYYIEIGTAINGDNWSTYIQPAVINSSTECYVTYSNMTWDRTRNVSSFYVYVTQVLDKANITEVPVEYDVQLKFKLAFWSITTLTPPHTFTVTHTDFNDTHFGEYSDSFVLQNIANMLQDLAFQDNVTILQTISNNIQNDSSGVADNLQDEVDSAYQVESAADGAIASALPDADNELDDILDYDYSTIGTDNLTALSFWKSLGDYILNNSNLVGIGALLIGCLFLGFVIYLLRL